MLTGSASGITFSGLSSGLDTASIIKKLVQLELQPQNNLFRQQALLQARKGTYDQFRGTLVNLNQAISAFNLPNAFNGMAATSSSPEHATLTSTGGASPGVHQLVVNRLATAERLSSTAQQSASAALGKTGAFTVNGTTVQVADTDSLQSIAEKVNNSNSGVRASVINGGEGRAYITFTSEETGVANSVNLADVTANDPISKREGVLFGLGLVALPGETVNVPAKISSLYASKTDSLNSILGENRGVEEIKIGAASVEVDFANDTLETLAAKINAVSGVDAQVVEEGGQFKLQIASANPLVVEGLDSFGLVDGTADLTFAASAVTTLVAAQDAEYKVDGITLTSSSNSITSVLNGSTITLVQADPTKTINLSVSRDTETVLTTIRGLVTAYNRVNAFIKDSSQFNAETYDSGPLFADSLANQVSATINNTIFSNAQGVASGLRNLTQVGFGLDEGGVLTLDESALRTAIETNPTEFERLMRAMGTSANSSITYVSSSAKTKASTAEGFEVNITQAATRTTVTAGATQTGPTAVEEMLNFTGAGFQSGGFQLAVPAGSSQTDVVNLINGNATLKGLVEARVEGGRLVVESKRYGGVGDFTVTSSADATGTSTGIGSDEQITKVVGLDVQGTINGEPATGSGRFLSGNEGNSMTEGLQIEYTGSTTGNIGSIQFTRGMSSMMFDTLDTFINFQNGMFKNSSDAIDAQIADLEASVTRISDRAKNKEVELRNRFAAMENAIARSQSQLAQLSNALNNG